MRKKDVTKAKLVTVAEEMNKTLELEPPIPTDDKITKTMLEKEIAESAEHCYKDGDVVSEETQAILAVLKIPFPDQSEATDESKDKEADKPKTAGKKKTSEAKKPSGTTFVGHKMCDNLDASFEEIKAECEAEGYTISDSTIKTVMSDVGKIVRYLKETGRIK